MLSHLTMLVILDEENNNPLLTISYKRTYRQNEIERTTKQAICIILYSQINLINCTNNQPAHKADIVIPTH